MTRPLQGRGRWFEPARAHFSGEQLVSQRNVCERRFELEETRAATRARLGVVRTRPSPLLLLRASPRAAGIMRAAVRIRRDARSGASTSRRGSNPPEPTTPAASGDTVTRAQLEAVRSNSSRYGPFTGRIEYESTQSRLSDDGTPARSDRVDPDRSRRSESGVSTSSRFGLPRVHYAPSGRHQELPLVGRKESKSSRR